jgi:hypothetical protein
MDNLAWSDFDTDEQRTLAMLADGVSTEFCDRVAVLTLTRLGLIRFSRLTPAAEQLLSVAIRHELGCSPRPSRSLAAVIDPYSRMFQRAKARFLGDRVKIAQPKRG